MKTRAADDRRRHARGLAVRRAVLGRAHVDRATRSATSFDREFQDLLTRYVWGEIWTRPGLPRKTRRLIVLATLVALNRLDELRMHVRAALEGGVRPDEVKEVLLQAAVYCGIPAARAAFEVAGEVLPGHGGPPESARARKARRVVRRRAR
jgi:4-carboxymuconolactone decarboxylase